MSLLVKTAALLFAVYAIVVFAAWLAQRRLMYMPDIRQFSPASVGLTDVTEQTLETPDGSRLIVWRATPQPGQPTILYFHGNAGGLVARADRLSRYRTRGWGVAMMSYRGYSGSTGRPTEAANVADARQLYERLVSEGIAPHDIVLYGESLGSGVAVQVAANVPVGGVILDAPYTSAVDVAVRAYPFLPVRPLLIDRYESDRRIDRIGAPLLILHGERDGIIPVAMGKALFAAAREPKKLVLFPMATHSDVDQFGAVDAIAAWLRDIRKP